MEVNILSFVGLAGIPLIMSLVELIKATFPTLRSRFLPGLTLLLAVLFNLAIGFDLQQDPVLAIFIGLVTGLSASGLYSGMTVQDNPVLPVYTPKVRTTVLSVDPPITVHDPIQ